MASEDPAEVPRIHSGRLAEAVAGAITLVDQIREVVPVVGCCNLALCDAQTRLEILTDSVGHRLCREAASLEFLRPPGGERRPSRYLFILRLNRSKELTFFGVEPFQIQRSSGDRLKHMRLHFRLASWAMPNATLIGYSRTPSSSLTWRNSAYPATSRYMTRWSKELPALRRSARRSSTRFAGSAIVYLRLRSPTSSSPSSGRHAPGTSSGLR